MLREETALTHLHAFFKELNIPKDQIGAHCDVLRRYARSHANAVSMIEGLKRDGWDLEHFRKLMAGTASVSECLIKLLKLHGHFRNDLHLNAQATILALTDHAFLMDLAAHNLHKRIEAALGPEYDREDVRRLFEQACCILDFSPRTLQMRRAKLLNHGVNVKANPLLLLEAHSSVALTLPRTNRDEKTLPDDTTVKDALVRDGWETEAIQSHLQTFPSIRELNPSTVYASLKLLRDHLGIFQESFTERLWQAFARFVIIRRCTELRHMLCDEVSLEELGVTDENIRGPVEAYARSIHELSLPVGPLSFNAKDNLHEAILTLEAWDVDRQLLRDHPELLVEQCRPIHTAHALARKFKLNAEDMRRNLQDDCEDGSLLVLFWEPDIIMKRSAEQRKLAVSYVPTAYVDDLDPCQHWKYFHTPTEELRARYQCMDERPIPNWRVESVIRALHAPSREMYISALRGHT